MACQTQNEKMPMQVSSDQDQESSATFVFSNGSLFSINERPERKPTELVERADRNITGRGSRNGQAIFESTSRLSRYPDFEDFTQRLSSYTEGWVHCSPSPSGLSRAGFFFTGQADLVRCYHCGIGLKDFSATDDPLTEHIRYSGNCSHLLDLLGPSTLAQLKRNVASGNNEVRSGNIRHPEFNTLESRLATFVKWPPSVVQTPAQLGDAGFFYTGTEDHVRCFSCDGGLRRWDPDDDPWTEHCRWFPACRYAIATKGQEYIALVHASAEHDDPEYNEPVPTVPASRISRDPALMALLDEYRSKFRDMGFENKDIEEGIEDVVNRGDDSPSIADVIDAIEIVKERRSETVAAVLSMTNETPTEENQRLKRILTCMKCEENRVNALLLPCTHHKLCIQCAESLSVCPTCQRTVSQKIKTFLV